MTIINAFWSILGICVLTDSLFRFGLLCLRAIKPPARHIPETESTSGCVILIAAHDEAGTIGETVRALVPIMSEWPGSSIWVVADRCSDDTAVEAARASAQVAVRNEGRLGKGAVIAWWMFRYEAIWQSRAAVLILDADSRLTPGSLRALRRVMLNGADAAQAFVSPHATTSSGRLAGWSEVLMQRIDDEARRRCGWSVPLRGTGMVFRGELLARAATRLHTQAEDLELDIRLASDGYRVRFVPEAVVTDPKPQQAAGASRQRARWLKGQLQVVRDYRSEIIRTLSRGGAGAWFLLVPLILRPKIVFIGLRFILLLFAPLPALIGLSLDAVYYLAGAAAVDRPGRYMMDLLATPGYAAMWIISLVMAMIQRGQKVWLRAGR